MEHSPQIPTTNMEQYPKTPPRTAALPSQSTPSSNGTASAAISESHSDLKYVLLLCCSCVMPVSMADLTVHSVKNVEDDVMNDIQNPLPCTFTEILKSFLKRVAEPELSQPDDLQALLNSCAEKTVAIANDPEIKMALAK